MRTSVATPVFGYECRRVNPSLHRPAEIELLRGDYAVDSNLYTLRVRYTADGDWQAFVGTHVPCKVSDAVSNSDISALHLESLPVNGPESLLLPGWPRFLVMGYQSKGGEWISCVPQPIKSAFQRRFAVGVVVSITGLGLMASTGNWPGALALLIGSHILRSAVAIARVPFVTYSTVHG